MSLDSMAERPRKRIASIRDSGSRPIVARETPPMKFLSSLAWVGNIGIGGVERGLE